MSIETKNKCVPITTKKMPKCPQCQKNGHVWRIHGIATILPKTHGLYECQQCYAVSVHGSHVYRRFVAPVPKLDSDEIERGQVALAFARPT